MKSNWESFRDEILAIINNPGSADKVYLDTNKDNSGASGELEFSEKDFNENMGSGGRISSDMGMRTDPVTGKEHATHGGVDIAGLGDNAKAYAIHDGEIIAANYSNTGGNMVILKYVDGDIVHEIVYMHLDSLAVRKGDEVQKHQVIGTVGSTGKSTGKHLHLEHRINGRKTRPSNQEINLSVMREVA